MRISENMKFNTMVDNMFKSQESYNKLAEKIASLKEINRPSDDPIGMNRVLNLRESRASVEQYTRNIYSCESWLAITESKLSAAGDLLADARVVAIAQSTATSTAEVRSSEAETVQQLIDEMLTLANSKYDGRYLFSGAKTETEPFSSSVRSAGEIGAAIADGGNTFDGDVTSSGTYEGLVDNTYVVKITGWTGDEVPNRTATYDVSDDEGLVSTGKTFVLPEDGSVETGDIGDGINLTFEDTGDNDLAVDDSFSVQAFAPEYYIGEPVQAEGNGFVGTVGASGTYTGSVNKTYVVKIVEGGDLDAATYRVSDDGGKTWDPPEPDDPLVDLDDGTITLGDGIDLDFDAGSADLTTNDIFYVHAFTDGYYNGNGEELSVNIGEGTPFDYSISGEAVFTDDGEGSVDVFGILNELKTALLNNDPDGIRSCLDGLEAASDQISKNISRCGTRMNRLEIAKNNLADMDLNLVGLISEAEDADISELISKLAMKEIVLKASYSVASSIGNLTIIDFLR